MKQLLSNSVTAEMDDRVMPLLLFSQTFCTVFDAAVDAILTCVGSAIGRMMRLLV